MDISSETLGRYAKISSGVMEPVPGTMYSRLITPNWVFLLRPVIYGFGWELTDIYDSDGNECYSYRYDYGEMSMYSSRERRDKVNPLLVLLAAMRDIIHHGKLYKKEDARNPLQLLNCPYLAHHYSYSKQKEFLRSQRTP